MTQPSGKMRFSPTVSVILALAVLELACDSDPWCDAECLGHVLAVDSTEQHGATYWANSEGTQLLIYYYDAMGEERSIVIPDIGLPWTYPIEPTAGRRLRIAALAPSSQTDSVWVRIYLEERIVAADSGLGTASTGYFVPSGPSLTGIPPDAIQQSGSGGSQFMSPVQF